MKKPPQSNKEGTVSSDEFVKIMMTLQNSSQLVADPSKTLSAKAQTETNATTAKRSREIVQHLICKLTLYLQLVSPVPSERDVNAKDEASNSSDIFSLHRSSSISGG